MTERTVSCARCLKTGRALAWPPYAGDAGETIAGSICTTCWEEWSEVQTKLINERRLNVLDPAHQSLVAEQCLIFLGLKRGVALPLPGPSGDPGADD